MLLPKKEKEVNGNWGKENYLFKLSRITKTQLDKQVVEWKLCNLNYYVMMYDIQIM